MKKLFLLLTLLTLPAFASVRVLNSSGTDLGSFSKIKCGGNLSCSASSGNMDVNLATSPSGTLQNQITATTTTLTDAQCGSTVVFAGAFTVKLPKISTTNLGCKFTFLVTAAVNGDIDPNDGTDIILPFADYAGAGATISPSAGDAIRGATAGMSIVLQAAVATKWVVVGGAQGTWADIN